MIGSMIPLIVCTLIGILSLIDRSSLNKMYGNMYDQKRINEKAKWFESLNEHVIPFTVGAVASFGVGAGLVALGLESSIAITVLTAMVNAVIVILLSMVIERFSSPPTPPGSLVDSGVKVDGTDRNPCTTS